MAGYGDDVVGDEMLSGVKAAEAVPAGDEVLGGDGGGLASVEEV
jgi:hypothetical protein